MSAARKLLLLGAAGFLGRSAAREFLQRGWAVFGADAAPAQNAPSGIQYEQLSLPSPALPELLRRVQPDACIHAAGRASVALSMSDPAADFQDGVVVTFGLLDALRLHAPKCRTVLLSSAAVYGNPARLPIREDDAPAPLSPYGFHKLQCELLAEEFARVFSLPVASARIFSAYGAGLRRQVVWDICEKALRGGGLRLRGTGRESRDFIHARDVASALAAIIEQAPMHGERYNLASGEETTIADLANALLPMLGLDTTAEFGAEENAGDPKNWRADIARLTALGYHPRVALSDGLRGVRNVGARGARPVMDALHLGLVAIGGKGWMGGANYVRNLAAAIRVAAPETRITWICGETLGDEWRGDTPQIRVPGPTRWRRWFGGGHAAFRRQLTAAGIDFVYPLTYDNFYNLGLRFPIQPALASVAWAGWIPDFQHRHLPELFSAEELRWRDAQMALLAGEAPRVFLSSEDALQDFRNFHPQHAAKGVRLTFRVGPAEIADGEPPRDLPERSFLVCNQFWRHKNHQVVFRALALLRARGVHPRVLCTGALSDYRGDEYVDELRALIAEGGVGEQVEFLGLVSRERLQTLMRHSLAIIQPSLFEGWSTVVEDARALGRPCLLSDLAVHREQDPPGARFFPPRSPEALAELMADVWRHGAPGPDRAAEAAARETARAQQVEFGREFLALARRLRNEQA